MIPDEQTKRNDETYRALGRFVVNFSGLLYSLEMSTIHLICPDPDTQWFLTHAALADRTANPTSSAFFSVFFLRWGSDVTDKDKEIIACLRREIEELIRIRNRIMHDAWLGTTVGGDPGPHAMVRARMRAHGKGAEYESVANSPADIDLLAENADRLRSMVDAVTWYKRPGQVGPELDGRLRIENGKVTR